MPIKGLLSRILAAGALLVVACSRRPDLTGRWEGHYPCCGLETISITQVGDTLIATKVTGDEYIPAGQITWRVSVKTRQGPGRVAGRGFVNPSYVPGRLEITRPDSITFYWNDDPQSYRRLQ